jgi:hypothetical protein
MTLSYPGNGDQIYEFSPNSVYALPAVFDSSSVPGIPSGRERGLYAIFLAHGCPYCVMQVLVPLSRIAQLRAVVGGAGEAALDFHDESWYPEEGEVYG